MTVSVLSATADLVETRLSERAPLAAKLFRGCLRNTLETTVRRHADGTTFVVTGDIPAMWLRDSAAQVESYVRFAKQDNDIRDMLRGVVLRQAACVAIDPYANAFNEEPNGHGHHEDLTEMSPWVWERKWELDSLCYPVRLCRQYWDATGDSSIFDETLHRMLTTIVATMRAEQHPETSPYSFLRPGAVPSDTLPFEGRGAPTRHTGMVRSAFRPSDDACEYGFLVPANMFAVVVLDDLAEFALDHFGDEALAGEAKALRDEIDRGIQEHAVVEHPRHGRVYAYEVDGLGNHRLMDDANVPSLLSIPYLGYRPATDPLYRNTRALVLSDENPYHYSGSHAAGIGSPHTPAGNVWPISLTMQALTATDPAELWRLVDLLASTTAGTGYMHESFDANDPAVFTRPWFGWANSLFAELIMRATL